MKRSLACIALLTLFVVSSGNHAQGELPVIKGPYLGQAPPGLTPELSAPSIVSTKDLEINAAFAPSMKEFYFVRQRRGESPKSHVIQYEDGAWHESVVERLSGGVFISPDGKTMHLANKYKERTDSGWSEEKSLGPLFKKFPIMRLTASAAGTYVFDEREEIDTIRYSRLVDGKREEPKAFGKEIKMENGPLMVKTGLRSCNPIWLFAWEQRRNGTPKPQ